MDTYQQEFHIDGDLFGKMRRDADRVLQELLKNMVEKDSLEGKITINIDIRLTKDFILNRNPDIKGETRKILIPKLQHKIGSVMQIKGEAKGDSCCDGDELVWDEESGEYVLRPIADTEQMSIFDADFQYVEDPDTENTFSGEGQAVLEGNAWMALPGPAEGDAEQDAVENEEEIQEPVDGFEDITDELLGENEGDVSPSMDDYDYENPEDME